MKNLRLIVLLSMLQLLPAFTTATEVRVIQSTLKASDTVTYFDYQKPHLTAHIGNDFSNGSHDSMLLDTGAFANMIGRKKLRTLGPEHLIQPLPQRVMSNWGIMKDFMTLDMALENLKSPRDGQPVTCTTSADFLIYETGWAPELDMYTILGHNFLSSHDAQIDYATRTVTFGACGNSSVPWDEGPRQHSKELNSLLRKWMGWIYTDPVIIMAIIIGMYLGILWERFVPRFSVVSFAKHVLAYLRRRREKVTEDLS